MAIPNQVSILGLLVGVLVASSFLSASALNSEGLHGRKLLSGDAHIDYVQPNVHPPDYDYPPPAAHMDYVQPHVHPPDYDYPPAATATFQDSKTLHPDYTAPHVHPPDYDYPPPTPFNAAGVNEHIDNHCSPMQGCTSPYV